MQSVKKKKLSLLTALFYIIMALAFITNSNTYKVAISITNL